MDVWWVSAWIAGSVIVVPFVYFVSRNFYFQIEPPLSLFGAPDDSMKFTSIYSPNWKKAQRIFFVSLCALYYAAYVLLSLLWYKIGKFESGIHLVLWTIAPPIWFSMERYFLFEFSESSTPEKQKADKESLKEGQDYASKLWASVLAVMLAFQLGEIIKPSRIQEPGGAPIVAGQSRM